MIILCDTQSGIEKKTVESGIIYHSAQKIYNFIALTKGSKMRFFKSWFRVERGERSENRLLSK